MLTYKLEYVEHVPIYYYNQYIVTQCYITSSTQRKLE